MCVFFDSSILYIPLGHDCRFYDFTIISLTIKYKQFSFLCCFDAYIVLRVIFASILLLMNVEALLNEIDILKIFVVPVHLKKNIYLSVCIRSQYRYILDLLLVMECTD